jgi:hypothetical protein
MQSTRLKTCSSLYTFQVVVIPFCQRLEIGPHISPSSRTLFYELREDKVFNLAAFFITIPYMPQIKEKFKSAIEAKLTYTIANALGVARQTSVVEERALWAVVLNNIPQYLAPSLFLFFYRYIQ